MNKLLAAAGAALVTLIAAQPASASHIFFENVAIDGVALDSPSGLTNPLFTVVQGGTLTFTLDGEGSSADWINATFGGVFGMTPSATSFNFGGGFQSFSQVLTFNALGSYQGNVFLDIPSSWPDYHGADGWDYETANLGFRVDVISAGGAVPEPATWAMMIAGFGGAGLMLRAGRRQAAALA